MSFQTYIKNIEEKTGKTAQDFQDFAEQKGFSTNRAGYESPPPPLFQHHILFIF